MQRKALTIDEALAATRQSARLAFAPNPTTEADWENLIRDLIAIANTAGGIVLVGVDKKGNPHPSRDPAPDTRDLAERLAPRPFQDFRIQPVTKNGKPITAIFVGHAPTPFVEHGIVYVRRGGKTKPASTKDLERATEKLLKQMRRELIAVVREVTAAAAKGTSIEIHHIEKPETAIGGQALRISSDESAPQVRISNPDVFWPYRQKEVAELVNQHLPANIQIRPYEIMCVRKVYHTDSVEEFTLKQSHASNKYSDQFVKWLAEQYRKDAQFFENACKAMRERSQ